MRLVRRTEWERRANKTARAALMSSRALLLSVAPLNSLHIFYRSVGIGLNTFGYHIAAMAKTLSVSPVQANSPAFSHR